MTLVRRGSALRYHIARRTWLEARPGRYAVLPGIHDDVTEDNRPALDELVEEMRGLGLFGASTIENRREALRRLVSELRGERVGVAW